MKFDKNHFHKLNESYEKVSNLSSDLKDFDKKNLIASRKLFKKISEDPSPIDVEVLAILSGISFEKNFIEFITPIMAAIRDILYLKNFYLVKPENLGVEYAVVKWPEDDLDEKLLKQAKEVINSSELRKFKLKVYGMQLHIDGCIILKCIDENESIFKFRKYLRKNTDGLPRKQSNWVHIPLGRILSPIGEEAMSRLKDFILSCDNTLNYDIKIDALHLVKEKKWYMEEKEYLLTKSLK
tara:strand:- start:17678 stop:18394 length:717 start_codon:yes stop_codon:yes gene_type:complete